MTDDVISHQLSAAEEADGASLYDLVVTVPHVLDARTGGNLVAHIKVGETYHQRKEVSEAQIRLDSGGPRFNSTPAALSCLSSSPLSTSCLFPAALSK